MAQTLQEQIESMNQDTLKDFKVTDFIKRLSDGTINPERFKQWVRNIYPTVIGFTDSLEANMRRAESTMPQLAKKMQNQLVEEREHNRVWENFMVSIGLDYGSINKGYNPNNSMNVLNNWLWSVNSNPNYSIQEGIASIYGVEAVLLPIVEHSLKGITGVARRCSPNSDVKWFQIHTEGEEKEHAKQGLAFLGSYNGSPIAQKIIDSIKTTHRDFLDTVKTS
ncbi:MAG: iron-containing redox enzyme family protein [Nanoarchaeota archaeon]